MIIFYLVLFVVLFYSVTIKSRKSLHMLQQNLYNENNRYLKWIKNNFTSTMYSYEIVSLFLLIIANYTNIILKVILSVIALLILILETEVIKYTIMIEKAKQPLVKTPRVRRQILVLYIINLIPFVIYAFIPDLAFKMIILSNTLLILNYFIVYFVKVINTPIERTIYKHYKIKATNKLASLTNLEVFGITGSYGKTSSKNTLNTILNTKFICRPTPKNFNTDLGLMTTINNDLTKFDEIFIAEMGAYKVGRIKRLCNLVKPKYGLLTKIGKAHLETFRTQENITRTKFELIESLPKDGIAFLNKDDKLQVEYNLRNKVRVVWYAVENTSADYYAKNIKCTNKGLQFDIYIAKENKSYSFETKLLGNHNISNIVAAVAVGYEFGIDISKMQDAVKSIKPVEHRLELKKIGVMYQIDDAYNSNPIGAKNALDVLSMMPGTKVVVTPGMVELGKEEKELNKEFGKQIAAVADYCILVGEKQTKPIYEGLIEKKYSKDKIIITNDVREAYMLVAKLKGKEDIYALFENDLPDIYKE